MTGASIEVVVQFLVNGFSFLDQQRAAQVISQTDRSMR
jgi:hypothetical protein